MPEDPNQLTLPGTPEVWSAGLSLSVEVDPEEIEWAGNGCYRAFISFDSAQDRHDRRVLKALLRIPGVEQAGSYFADAGRPHGWQVEFDGDVLEEVRRRV